MKALAIYLVCPQEFKKLTIKKIIHMNMNRFNYLISFLMTLSLVFAVGSEAMVYPADVRAISISGAGVAGSGSPQINPAILIS